MARDQVLSFRCDHETAEVLRSLPESEGTIANVEEAVAKAIRLTVAFRRVSGETFREWLLSRAECERDHPEPAKDADREDADPAPSPEALELARLRGREEERVAVSVSLQARLREIDAARAKVEEDRRDLRNERESFEVEYRAAVADFNREVQDRNAQRPQHDEALRAEGRRDLHGALLQWDLYGRQSDFALRAVRQAAEQVIADQVQGAEAEPATALLLAARLVTQVAAIWNPELEAVRRRGPDGRTTAYRLRFVEPGAAYMPAKYRVPRLLGIAFVLEGVAQEAATEYPLRTAALPRSAASPSQPEALLPGRRP